MKFNKSNVWKRGAGFLAACAATISAAEPSSESLLQLLEKKGILTGDEAKALRTEQLATKNAAAVGKPTNGLPVIKFSGDFRGRFEGLYGSNPAFIDRDRLRYRLRAGMVATLSDKFETGVRLISGEAANGAPGGNPLSGNTTFQDNASKKFAFIDLAYGRWREVQNDDVTAVLTLGKMESPFVFTDLVIDYDYTPEGIAQQFTWKVSPKQKLALNLAGFVVDGLGLPDSDPLLGGAQLRLDSDWNKHWQTSASISGLVITGSSELANGNVPNQNRGNSRLASNTFGAGPLAEHFAPIVADASVTYWVDHLTTYPGRFPIKLGGEFLHNFSAHHQNQAFSANVYLGKAGKKGQWEFSYRYKYLEGDSWYEELVDDDFGAFYQSAPDAGGAAGYASGTNVRGHVLKACYSVSDSFTLAATAFFTELVKPSPANSESAFTRLQVDAIWKF